MFNQVWLRASLHPFSLPLLSVFCWFLLWVSIALVWLLSWSWDGCREYGNVWSETAEFNVYSVCIHSIVKDSSPMLCETSPVSNTTCTRKSSIYCLVLWVFPVDSEPLKLWKSLVPFFPGRVLSRWGLNKYLPICATLLRLCSVLYDYSQILLLSIALWDYTV